MSDEQNNVAPEQKPSDDKAEKNTFTKEYVSELRSEAVSLRKKISEIEEIKKSELENKEKEISELFDKKISEVGEIYKKEIMVAKLEAHAIKAGIVDVDGIKLADLSKISVDENNKLIGGEELIEELKKTKPYLFLKVGASSTYAKETPKPSDAKPFNAMSATPEEYKKHRELMMRK